MAWIGLDEYLWRKLISHARGCSITYRQKIRIRGERQGGTWRYRAYLPNGRPCSAVYRFRGGNPYEARVTAEP